MDVTVAEMAGFCGGVAKAIRATRLVLLEAKEAQRGVFYLNATVHNKEVMNQLSKLGFKKLDLTADSPEGGIFIVSAHGAAPLEFERISRLGFNLIDTTCVKVRHFQQKVEEAHDEGYQVILFGDQAHPEIKGIAGRITEVAIIGSPEEAKELELKDKAALFCQTTYNRKDYERVAAILLGKNPTLKVVDTICSSVEKRVKAACALAQKVEIMIVVGSPESSNTKNLAKAIIASASCKVKMVENVTALQEENLKGFKKAGVTAGASTPKELISQVVSYLENL